MIDTTHRFATAWELAQFQVEKAQERQKFFHDKLAKQPDIRVGDRVFVYHPAKRWGKVYMLAPTVSSQYILM